MRNRNTREASRIYKPLIAGTLFSQLISVLLICLLVFAVDYALMSESDGYIPTFRKCLNWDFSNPSMVLMALYTHKTVKGEAGFNDAALGLINNEIRAHLGHSNAWSSYLVNAVMDNIDPARPDTTNEFLTSMEQSFLLLSNETLSSVTGLSAAKAALDVVSNFGINGTYSDIANGVCDVFGPEGSSGFSFKKLAATYACPGHSTAVAPPLNAEEPSGVLCGVSCYISSNAPNTLSALNGLSGLANDFWPSNRRRVEETSMARMCDEMRTQVCPELKNIEDLMDGFGAPAMAGTALEDIDTFVSSHTTVGDAMHGMLHGLQRAAFAKLQKMTSNASDFNRALVQILNGTNSTELPAYEREIVEYLSEKLQAVLSKQGKNMYQTLNIDAVFDSIEQSASNLEVLTVVFLIVNAVQTILLIIGSAEYKDTIGRLSCAQKYYASYLPPGRHENRSRSRSCLYVLCGTSEMSGATRALLDTVRRLLLVLMVAVTAPMMYMVRNVIRTTPGVLEANLVCTIRLGSSLRYAWIDYALSALFLGLILLSITENFVWTAFSRTIYLFRD
jgi:hypothetical protein